MPRRCKRSLRFLGGTGHKIAATEPGAAVARSGKRAERELFAQPAEDVALQNRLDAFTADDVEQHERWAGRPLRAPLQLRDVADREVEIAGKDGLAQVCAFAQPRRR